MSKIQKALEKVQAERANRVGKRTEDSDHDSDSVVVAQLVAARDDRKNTALLGGKPGGRRLEISFDALRAAGLVAAEADEEMLSRQYQGIKRPLIAHAFGKRATKVEDGNIIMITSSIPGEGKTFLSINLALSMAQEKDHTVLLVDADVAKRQTSEIFGVAGEKGLLDLLEDSELSLESAILPTDVPGLMVMPAGQPCPNATELLASDRMEELISALGSLRDGGIVILDSPPLIQTSEAKVLATIVGQVVLVVRAEKTARDVVLSAVETLGNRIPVNLVLNQARTKQISSYYSYGSGSYSGQKETVLADPVGKDMWGT